ncbi:(2Fe-2S)-binding protein [Rhodococcoides kyotonense]|uniref:Ferric siderophore reductase C-terminal domain-containing protein n=1 Tax=Rhodococcoides kyotonense TaxID=398843 RepID=A0A239N3S7_9NOCA|nr:(2Fe-2S)-binding protein [Rhodococcus kyotonensis]SNT49103.1 hypothetical protein SAMN05421642_1285 [Rhodococcus kyotonensis]
MSIYSQTIERVPALADYLDGPFDLPATIMLDSAWIRARVDDTGRRWDCDDDRVNATLWWYSASSTLAFVAVATSMVTGRAADPALETSTCFLRANGYLGGVCTDRILDIDHLSAAFDNTLGAVIDVLSSASGVRRRVLWAITTDSIANRALDVGAALDNRELGSRFATAVIERMRAPLPTPRFVDVGGRRFTRRCSCCLLYETQGADKCSSCPRRPSAERRDLLAAAARNP